MRRPGAYPLERLRTLRSIEQRVKTLDLAEALTAEQAAAAVVSAAEARRDAIRQMLSEVRFPLPATAATLVAVEARAAHLRARLAAEEQSISRARAALRDAERATAAARGNVVDARARAQVVERHHDRWQEQEKRRRERREED